MLLISRFKLSFFELTLFQSLLKEIIIKKNYKIKITKYKSKNTENTNVMNFFFFNKKILQKLFHPKLLARRSIPSLLSHPTRGIRTLSPRAAPFSRLQDGLAMGSVALCARRPHCGNLSTGIGAGLENSFVIEFRSDRERLWHGASCVAKALPRSLEIKGKNRSFVRSSEVSVSKSE